MKHRFIIIVAFVAATIDSRLVRSSNHDEEAPHRSPRMNFLRENLIEDVSDSRSNEVPNAIDDSTARESIDEVLTNLITNDKNYRSSPLILSRNEKLRILLNDLFNEDEDRTATQSPKHSKPTTDKFAVKNNSEFKYSGNSHDLSDVLESAKPSSEILKTANSPKDLVDPADGIDIYYQDSHDDGRHVISRHEDSSASFRHVRDADIGLNRIDSSTLEAMKNEANRTEELDTMLLELQGQVNRMRKYLDGDCGKHRKSSRTDSIDQPNEIITLQ